MKFTSFVIKLLANEEIVDRMKLRAALIGEVGTRRFLPLTPASRPESHHCQYKRVNFPVLPVDGVWKVSWESVFSQGKFLFSLNSNGSVTPDRMPVGSASK